MSKLPLLIASAAVAFGTLAAPAYASEDLAKAKACIACHAMDKKGPIGPGFKEISAAYASDKNAEATLVARILKGSEKEGDKFKTKFGQMPMMPNTAVKEDEARTLAKWILSLK
jgi:cytochrome c